MITAGHARPRDATGRHPAQAGFDTEDRHRLRAALVRRAADEWRASEEDRFLIGLLDPADRHGTVDPAEQRQARPVEPPPQRQRGMRPGTEEIVVRSLLQHEAGGPRIEEYACQPGADVPLHVPARSKGELAAAVVEIDRVHVEPAVQQAVADRVESNDPAEAFRVYVSISRDEFAEAARKAIAELDAWRAGAVQVRGGQVNDVREEAVHRNRSGQPILDVRKEHLSLERGEETQRRHARIIKQWIAGED